MPPHWFWPRVRALCDAHGAKLIFDEIPTGLGKTGKLFVSEHFGVVPDITVLGKALGGVVVPIAAMIGDASLDVASDLPLGHYTREKNPFTCRAALTVLEVIESEGLVERAAELGARSLKRIQEMASAHAAVREARGCGLLMAVEFRDHPAVPAAEFARSVMVRCLGRGLSVSASEGCAVTLSASPDHHRSGNGSGADHPRRGNLGNDQGRYRRRSVQMRLVTYNIHFGVGKDGRYELARIADAVRGADVIGLNEVERNWPRGGGPGDDQPAELARLLPDYYWVYGPYFDMDASVRGEDGRIDNRRRQHGSMLLSKVPIRTSRLHVFPKFDTVSHFNHFMGAIEGVIEHSGRAIRFYAVHLSSMNREERLLQIGTLLESHRRTGLEGGMWTGPGIGGSGVDWSCGESPPPNPAGAILMGDFNCEPESDEYRAVMGATPGAKGEVLFRHAFVDAWSAAEQRDGATILADSNRYVSRDSRIDYCFLGAELADRLVTARVDREAAGSDHQPLWVEIRM